MSAASTLFRLAQQLSDPAIAYGSEDPAHVRMMTAVQAVQAVKERGTATINDIAEELGIDQSGASRLMSQAISAGYVQRDRAESDGRARECGLTPAGEKLLQQARKWQDEMYFRLTADWSDDERVTFENQILRLLAATNKTE